MAEILLRYGTDVNAADNVRYLSQLALISKLFDLEMMIFALLSLIQEYG